MLIFFSRFWNQDDDMCPLHRAVEDGDFQSLDLLFAAGANVDSVAFSTENDVRTSLLDVAISNQNEEMVQYLINKGAEK